MLRSLENKIGGWPLYCVKICFFYRPARLAQTLVSLMKISTKRHVIATFLCGLLASVTLAKTNLVPIYQLLLSNAQASGDLLITNANIYTVDSNQNTAQAMLVEEGTITKIGTNAEVNAAAPKDIPKFDLDGRFVMSGFQDAHLHVAEAGFNEIMCLFEETEYAISDYSQAFQDCNNDPENAGSPWVLGAGISVAEMLADTSQTPRAFLDGLFPAKPVLALDNLGHGAWANSKALTLAFPSINLANPQQPRGGILLADANGATGELFENAQQRVRDIAFSQVDPDQAFSYAGLIQGLATVAKFGITTVSDAGGYWTRKDHMLWQRAEREGRMTTRAFNTLYVFPDKYADAQIQSITALYDYQEGQLASFNQAKCVFLQPWPPNFTKRGHLHQAFKRSSDFNVKWLHFALL